MADPERIVDREGCIFASPLSSTLLCPLSSLFGRLSVVKPLHFQFFSSLLVQESWEALDTPERPFRPLTIKVYVSDRMAYRRLGEIS
jgi:hypothetical protein